MRAKGKQQSAALGAETCRQALTRYADLVNDCRPDPRNIKKRDCAARRIVTHEHILTCLSDEPTFGIDNDGSTTPGIVVTRGAQATSELNKAEHTEQTDR